MDSIARLIRASNSENGSGSVLQDTGPEDALAAERQQLLASLLGLEAKCGRYSSSVQERGENRSSCFKEPEGHGAEILQNSKMTSFVAFFTPEWVNTK